MLISFFQLAIALPSVYEVKMPRQYQEWMRIVSSWLDIEVRSRPLVPHPACSLSSPFSPPLLVACFGPSIVSLLTSQVIFAELIPSECLGQFSMRLVLRVAAPLLVILFLIVGYALARVLHRFFTSPNRRWSKLLPEKYDCLKGVPLALIIAFCLYPSVSRVVFQSWACTEYKLDDETGAFKSFLTVDQSATHFLWREYRLGIWWWEPIEMLRKVTLAGLLLVVIPSSLAFIRLLVAVVFSLLVLVFTLFVWPYQREDNNAVSICSEWQLVAYRYLTAMVIKVHVDFTDQVGVSETTDVLGFYSTFDLSMILLVFYGLVVILTIAILVLQASGLDSCV
ncbi:MAG: hypothetical protein SGPRY_015083 [Prymnesium sp.]